MKIIFRAIIAFLIAISPASAIDFDSTPPFSSYSTPQQFNSATLRSTLAKVGLMTSAAPAQIRMVMWGDSTAQFHAGPLASILALEYPLNANGSSGSFAGVYGAFGPNSFNYPVPAQGVVTSGGVTTIAGGTDYTQTPTGGYYIIPVGGCVTLNVGGGYWTANKFSLLYIKQNGAGTLSLNTNNNGAGWVSQATANAQAASPTGAVLSYTAGSASLYQMQACVSGAGPVTLWLAGIENTLSNGVVAISLGQPGASLAQELTPPSAITQPWFNYILPDLVTFEMKMNGGGWTQAQLQTWASAWQTTNAQVDLLLIGSYPVSAASNDAQNQTQNGYLKQFALANNGVYWDGYGIFGPLSPSGTAYATEKALGAITDVSSPHQTTLGQQISSNAFVEFLGAANWPAALGVQGINTISVQSQSILVLNPISGPGDTATITFQGGNSPSSALISASWYNAGLTISCIRDLSGKGILLNSNGGTNRFYMDCASGYIGLGNNQSPNDALDLSSAGGIIYKTTTVGALPTCNAAHKGDVYAVSDATAPTYNATLTGGGSVYALALCNGSAWTAH